MMLPRNGNGNSIFPEGYFIVAATLFLTRNMIRLFRGGETQSDSF